MSREIKTVFIIGAGCSAGKLPTGPGFPSACEFLAALEEFSQRLAGEDCEKLKSLVVETAELLRQEKVQTLDALAARLGAEAHGSFSTALTTREKQTRDQQVRNARIATAAVFLDLEKRAKKMGLPRYDNFLTELFGNSTDWAKASRNANASVLTFNYDRLFEMAFLNRFKCDTGQNNLYGKSLLNSGLDYPQGNSFEVATDRFAFLKLHGSVGIRARNEVGDSNPRIYTCSDGLPGDQGKPINDEMFFARCKNVNPFERDPEPLIVFPHDKPFVAHGTKTLLSFRSYIPWVWNEARRLISEATQIWSIGYSFAPMDREDVVGLLRSAQSCKELIVQDLPGAAERTCQRLRKKWIEPEGLNLKTEAYPQPF
jgi:hypothetical protein